MLGMVFQLLRLSPGFPTEISHSAIPIYTGPALVPQLYHRALTSEFLFIPSLLQLHDAQWETKSKRTNGQLNQNVTQDATGVLWILGGKLKSLEEFPVQLKEHFALSIGSAVFQGLPCITTLPEPICAAMLGS